MLSKRQRQLLRTLDEGPRSGSELARALGVSRRTVIREVASVSAWLESMGAGSIASDPNYHLVVTSDEALASLLVGRDAAWVGGVVTVEFQIQLTWSQLDNTTCLGTYPYLSVL